MTGDVRLTRDQLRELTTRIDAARTNAGYGLLGHLEPEAALSNVAGLMAQLELLLKAAES